MVDAFGGLFFGFSPEAATSYNEMLRGFNSGHIVFENNAATKKPLK